jgi:1,4-alpha-glucan branching enzyme
MALIWSENGYPSGAAYRDYHRHTTYRHRVWRNDGDPYDRDAAQEQAAADARDFVTRSIDRVAQGGVCVCALDTELLGHWWYEGIDWLRAVIDESARQGLALTTLDAALDRHQPRPAPSALGVSSWGEGADLRTWSGPDVAELAWRARAAKLRLAAAAPLVSERALRELLALQSSDWAFMTARRLAGDYPEHRSRRHRELMVRALDGDDSLSGLAPDLSRPMI